MSISYREKKGKYIICKDGVYVALDINQVIEMEAVMRDIREGTRKFFKEDARKCD